MAWRGWAWQGLARQGKANLKLKIMEEKTTKVLVEISADFDKKLELSLAIKKANYQKTTKAKEIVRLAEQGFDYGN